MIGLIVLWVIKKISIYVITLIYQKTNMYFYNILLWLSFGGCVFFFFFSPWWYSWFLWGTKCFFHHWVTHLSVGQHILTHPSPQMNMRYICVCRRDRHSEAATAVGFNKCLINMFHTYLTHTHTHTHHWWAQPLKSAVGHLSLSLAPSP